MTTPNPDVQKEAEKLAEELYPWRVQRPNPIPYKREGFRKGFLKAWHLARASAFEECANTVCEEDKSRTDLMQEFDILSKVERAKAEDTP